MTFIKTSISLIVPVVFSAMTPCHAAESNSPVASLPFGADATDGFWLSDGYGFFAEKRGAVIDLREVSTVSCISAMKAKRAGREADRERYLAAGERGEGGGPATLLVTGEGARMRVTFVGAISDVMFDRVKSKPTSCLKPTPNTPQSNYAVFWQAFADHYPFFGLRKADWNAVDRKVRPTIKSNTKPHVLFEKLKGMIEPYGDAHTGLRALPLKLSYVGYRRGNTPMRNANDPRIIAIIKDQYLATTLKSYCNGQLQYGVLKDGTGYLRLLSFYDYIPNGKFTDQVAALDAAFDDIITDLASRPGAGLIIDERINGGGSDIFGTIMAGRLTDTSYLAYRKVVRNDLKDQGGRTQPQDAIVNSSTLKKFLGPVALLTGNDSISAAETFAMALMGRPNKVTRIGQPTQGVFSDVLSRKMPNGWKFGLPNEIYLAEDGRAFDGPGMLPDVETPVFTDDDLAAKRDSAIDSALKHFAIGPAPE